MTSLVTELLVNPVLRQARRFSFSRPSFASDLPHPDSPRRTAQACPLSPQDEPIVETDEAHSLQTDSEDSASSRRSSCTSVVTSPSLNTDRVDGAHSSPHNTAIPVSPDTSVVDAQVSSPRNTPPEIVASSMNTHDPPASPSMRNHTPLPEDDGMSSMRKRILAIQAQGIANNDKAYLMHQLLQEGYTRSQARITLGQPLSPASPRPSEAKQASHSPGPLESFKFWHNALGEAEVGDEFALTDQDLEPTFVPKEQPAESTSDAADGDINDEKLLGCEHYRRNVKLQCSTCDRWYTCRFCHDNVENHTLIRKETRNMLCMFCGTAQKASHTCVSCEAPAASYYCDICKLWNDDPNKPCYHCSDCGICRIGHGIGKDFYHCKKCCACIAISTQSDHKCIERAIDCDCPICGDYMFTSPKRVCFMRCGHSIHRDCLDEHLKTSYKCPICNKSLLNMESQFRNLDLSIQAQPMPPEFKDTRAMVLCHDCSAKSSTIYHWLGLKCGVCQSFNTAQLQIIGLDGNEVNENDLAVGRSAQVPGMVHLGHSDLIGMDGLATRGRRRHSSSVPASAFVGADIAFFPTDRRGRSVSPIPTPGRLLHASGGGGYFDLEGDEDNGDIFGFWRRFPRSLTSHDEEDDDDAGESSDEMTSDDEMGDDDDAEESEDDDFDLLGHR